jgi:hypothetical protein
LLTGRCAPPIVCAVAGAATAAATPKVAAARACRRVVSVIDDFLS